MKLLISTYACLPNRGSDHGVGWNWTTEAHRLGHEVWALVSPAHRNDFISWLPQRKLFELYDSHDLLLFPSLHDSGGFVVLEALCHGMPVVCLDLGGPKETVTPDSGLIIKTDGRNTTQVASSIADELHNELQSPTTLAHLSSGAISRANDFILPNRVARFYQEALKYIEGDATSSAPPVARSRAEALMAPFPADGA